jgi:hypothetical protein
MDHRNLVTTSHLPGGEPGHVPNDQVLQPPRPAAIADIIVYLVSDAAAPVSGAIVPAYGA